jgi:hypothetical protein
MKLANLLGCDPVYHHHNGLHLFFFFFYGALALFWGSWSLRCLGLETSDFLQRKDVRSHALTYNPELLGLSICLDLAEHLSGKGGHTRSQAAVNIAVYPDTGGSKCQRNLLPPQGATFIID